MEVYGIFHRVRSNPVMVDFTLEYPSACTSFYSIRRIPLEEAIQRLLGTWQEPQQIERPSYPDFRSSIRGVGSSRAQRELWYSYAYGNFDWPQTVVIHDELAVVNSAWERYYAQTT